MEWKETTFRKFTISEKSQKKTLDERYAHIRKFELNNTNIQETEIFIGRITKDSEGKRNQAYINALEIDNNYQQGMDHNSNLASFGDSNIVENYELANDNAFVENEINGHGVEDSVTQTGVKAKIGYVNDKDANDIKNENATQYESNVAESGFLNSPCSSKSRRYSDNHIEGSEERMKIFHNENIQVGNLEVLKNSIKKCQSTFTLFSNEVGGKETNRDTGSKSVIDLISYFESLSTPEKSKTKSPNLKSKTKKSTSKQDPKGQQTMKFNKDNQSKINDSLSAKHYSKITQKIDAEKKSAVNKSEVTLRDVDAANMERDIVSIQEDIPSSVTSHNGKRAAEISPENDLPNLSVRNKIRRTDVILEEFLPSEKANDTKRATEITSELMIPEENIDVRKRSTEIVSKAFLPSLIGRKSRHRMSLTAKSGMCAFCKGKCVHIERSLNRSKSNEAKTKEHVFVFSDEVYKKTENSRIPNPTCCRSCSILNNVKPMCQLFFPKLNDAKENVGKLRLTSDIKKTKGNGNFLNNNTKQGEVNLSTTRNKVNRLPTTQNSTKIQKQGNHSEQNKPKTSERRPYVKRFIGILLTAVIMSTVLYKGITKNYSIW